MMKDKNYLKIVIREITIGEYSLIAPSNIDITGIVLNNEVLRDFKLTTKNKFYLVPEEDIKECE